MENMLNMFQQVMSVPCAFIDGLPFLADFVKESIKATICFVPWLFILYWIIDKLERFFLSHMYIFTRFMRFFRAFFGATIAMIPECGYPVLASVLYARKMITKGTLFAFLIATSDDALPMLFIDMTKIPYLLPIIITKFVLAIIVAIVIDTLFMFGQKNVTLNSMNTDINVAGCCNHRISTVPNITYGWKHPMIHTFNMFMFVLITLLVLNFAEVSFGGIKNLANFLLVDTIVPIFVVALFGLVPNCAMSVVLALCFVKGVISFPAFMAGMITTNGLALYTLSKHHKGSHKNLDVGFITLVLYVLAVLVGLAFYYNIDVLRFIG